MFTWKILEMYADGDKLIAVRYHLTGSDENNTVESEGRHTFESGTVNKPLVDIVENDIGHWIEKDTTQNGVCHIKLGVENQLKALETSFKVNFPWEDTFTVE